LYSEVSAFIPYETIEVVAEDFLDIFIAADVILVVIGILLVLILTIMVSIIKFMLGYANFSVERSEDEVLITRGLIEKKQIAFKLHRIQAVTIVEGLLRQPFGYCEVRVNVVGDISTQQNITPKIHPFIKSIELQNFLDTILPGYVLEREINKLPKRSLQRYVIRGVVPFLLLAPAFFFIPYGFLGILIYPPLAFLAVMRYRDAGYLINGNFITLRFRQIARTTALVSKNHIQSINLNTNYLQKRKDLKTIAAVTLSAPAAVAFTVKDISADCGKIIWNWFSWKGHVSKKN
jgi:putative membrane protein